MNKLQQLRVKALESCVARGHVMGRFAYTHFADDNYSDSQGNAECIHCGKWVHIETQPDCNSINISGTAVAMNCGDLCLTQRED